MSNHFNVIRVTTHLQHEHRIQSTIDAIAKQCKDLSSDNIKSMVEERRIGKSEHVQTSVFPIELSICSIVSSIHSKYIM